MRPTGTTDAAAQPDEGRSTPERRKPSGKRPEPRPEPRPARTWSEFVSLRWRKIEKVKSNLGKVALARFLRRRKMPYLKVLKTFASSADIRFDGMPDCFVLKPASLWSGQGVMLLHRVSGVALWYDAKSRRVMTEPEILQSCGALERKHDRGLVFMAEERAFDEDPGKIIPLDYKVFTFLGVTKFVLQVDRNENPPRMAFFDGDFEPIHDDRVTIPQDKAETAGIHRKPDCAMEILALARDLTIALEAPFISVDCYATRRGPVFGELTHTPGGPWYRSMYRFSDAFERELGEAWRLANQKLGRPEVMVDLPYKIRFGGKIIRIIS